MKKQWIGIWILAAALGWAAAGCNSGGDGAEDFHPAVDVNGKWDVRMDGDPLGMMKLEVSKGGALKGSLTTTQGANAKLSGAMDEYVAEFTMNFPTESYLGQVTFNSDASGASGTLVDRNGFKHVLSMTPRFDV